MIVRPSFINAEHERGILTALHGMKEGLTIIQICETTEMKGGLVRTTCKGMEEKGLVQKLGKGGKGDPYRYSSEREILSLQPEEYRKKEKATWDDDLEARYAEEFGFADV